MRCTVCAAWPRRARRRALCRGYDYRHLSIAQWQRHSGSGRTPARTIELSRTDDQATADGLGIAALRLFAADRYRSLSRLRPYSTNREKSSGCSATRHASNHECRPSGNISPNRCPRPRRAPVTYTSLPKCTLPSVSVNGQRRLEGAVEASLSELRSGDPLVIGLTDNLYVLEGVGRNARCSTVLSHAPALRPPEPQPQDRDARRSLPGRRRMKFARRARPRTWRAMAATTSRHDCGPANRCRTADRGRGVPRRVDSGSRAPGRGVLRCPKAPRPLAVFSSVVSARPASPARSPPGEHRPPRSAELPDRHAAPDCRRDTSRRDRRSR